MGCRGTNGRAGFGCGKRTQAYAVGQVRLQAAQAAFLQTLRSQEKVHANGTADAPDLHKQFDKLRLGSQQLTKLVNHHKQDRQRIHGG